MTEQASPLLFLRQFLGNSEGAGEKGLRLSVFVLEKQASRQRLVSMPLGVSTWVGEKASLRSLQEVGPSKFLRLCLEISSMPVAATRFQVWHQTEFFGTFPMDLALDQFIPSRILT